MSRGRFTPVGVKRGAAARRSTLCRNGVDDRPELCDRRSGGVTMELQANLESRDIRGQMDRWVQEQVFEEDVRAVIGMLRPHRRERLLGWSEHRTGGAHFRVTVSWDEHLEQRRKNQPLVVPQMADVLETLLVGSAKDQDELQPKEEFELYRSVVRELHR